MHSVVDSLKKLFLREGKGGEKGRETSIVCLSHAAPLHSPGIGLDRNQTSNRSLCRLMPNRATPARTDSFYSFDFLKNPHQRTFFFIAFRERGGTLTSVAQLVGRCSTKQEVAGSVLGPGTCLGCNLLVQASEATSQCFSLTSVFLSLSFSLPSPLSKNK